MTNSADPDQLDFLEGSWLWFYTVHKFTVYQASAGLGLSKHQWDNALSLA